MADLETLYQTYGPMVLRRCRRLLRDEERALDAMHDVFLKILRRGAPLHDAAPASLLLQAATHVCLNHLRSDRRHPVDREEEVLLAIAAADEETPESRALARRWLVRLFSDAPASTRVMAVLFYVDRLTLEEVAAEVGLSVSGVRKRLRTLRERLPLLEQGARHVGTTRTRA
jgi:RNA polymerase sigma-70 factor, ECF subfamily